MHALSQDSCARGSISNSLQLWHSTRLQIPASTKPRRLIQRHKTVACAVDPSKLLVQVCTPQEYFPAADLHATCFEHSSSPNQALWQRFERIWALQINDDLAQRGVGNCMLLVAYDPEKAPAAIQQRPAAPASMPAADDSSNSSSSSSSSQVVLPQLESFSFPQLGYWLSRMVNRQVWPELGSTFDELGIVGVAQIDSFGDIIPPRTLSASRDGAFGWVKREGIAYISNVAVAPSARRCGVAQRLMAEAESLAASWGCSRAGLHCNPKNEPAMQLYRRLRYRKGVLEAPWMPYVQGRAPDRCYLMLKRLTQQLQEQQGGRADAASGASEAAAGAAATAAA